MSDDLLDAWNGHVEAGRARVVDGRGAHAFRDVDAHANGIAGTLLSGRASLEGERIAILASPGASFVAALIGIWKSHGTAVVLLPEHPEDEWTYALSDAGVERLLVTTDLSAKSATRRAVPTLIEEIAPSHARTGRDASGDSPALMLYTSGTTSKPKGAVLTRENIRIQAALLQKAWAVTPDDTLLHSLPLHHMHGLAIALVNALFAGASVHMLKFAAHEVLTRMKDATIFMAVPTMYAKLLQAFDAASPAEQREFAAHARGLRLATSGSAALPVGLGERVRELAGQFPLERFGMTEIGVGLTNPLAQEGRRPGFVGYPLPTVETRITDDHGQDSTEGELWVRGPSVFPRYHQRPEATAAAFAKDAEGRTWFRTGDTVTRDGAHGPFKILGRTSQDILKSGGYKLSALEIEEVLREHPLVSEVAVIGLSDEVWGDRVVACIVAKGHVSAGAEDGLRAFAKEKLAFYKVPKEFVLLAELPKNTLGKVQKPALKAALAGKFG
jgi:malonyl-CoA/methylmalonyl-CoA synthetase